MVALQTDGQAVMWGANWYGACSPPLNLGLCSKIAGGHYHSFAIQADPLDIDGDGILNTKDNCVSIANPTQSDCNGDGIGDVCAIDAGEPDTDFDGRPDACEVAYGDFNLDGAIGGLELSVIIGGWGSSNPSIGDMNVDGIIDAIDLTVILARWGSVPY